MFAAEMDKQLLVGSLTNSPAIASAVAMGSLTCAKCCKRKCAKRGATLGRTQHFGGRADDSFAIVTFSSIARLMCANV